MRLRKRRFRKSKLEEKRQQQLLPQDGEEEGEELLSRKSNNKSKTNERAAPQLEDVASSDQTETTAALDEYTASERSVILPSQGTSSSASISARSRLSAGIIRTSSRLSNNLSPRKAKKRQLAKDLLEESFRLSVAEKEEKERQTAENKKTAVFFRYHTDLGMHYFWGSPILLQLYAIVGVALILGSLWVLHGIYILLVAHMALRAVVWGSHIFASQEFADACALVNWAMHKAMDEIERAVHGDSFRIWVAGASHLAWAKVGKALIMQLLREQYHQINATVVKENIDKLERNKKLYQQLFQKSMKLRQNIADQVKQRGSELRQFRADVNQRGMEFREAVKERGIELRDTMMERGLELRYNVQVFQDAVVPKGKKR